MFQIVFKAFKLIMLFMDWINSIPIFHKNITYILKEKISKYILLYINNVLVRGLAIQYKLKNRSYEMYTSNPRIRRFIFKYLTTVNQIL